jgi:hypothetical protein
VNVRIGVGKFTYLMSQIGRMPPFRELGSVAGLKGVGVGQCVTIAIAVGRPVCPDRREPPTLARHVDVPRLRGGGLDRLHIARAVVRAGAGQGGEQGHGAGDEDAEHEGGQGERMTGR